MHDTRILKIHTIYLFPYYSCNYCTIRQCIHVYIIFCLEMVCKNLPSPLELSENKVERLMSGGNRNFLSLPSACKELKTAFLNCSSKDDAPVIVFVSKMFAVETKLLPENKPKSLTTVEIAERRQQVKERIMLVQQEMQNGPGFLLKTDADDQPGSAEIEIEDKGIVEDSFIAFARIYSGTLKKGKRLYVLGPRHDPRCAILTVPNYLLVEW